MSVELDHTGNSVTVVVEHTGGQNLHACPECSASGRFYDTKPRKWRHLDTCQYLAIIQAEIPRIECKEHGVRMISVPWAEKGSRYTALYELLIISWLKDGSISAVARHFGMGWDAVEGIRDRAVKRGLARRGQLKPVHLQIDETSEKKGHKYLTIVSEKKKVLYVTQGRKKEDLEPFWGKLADAAVAGIQSISMDLWQAYMSNVQEHVPQWNRTICLDRFHVAGYYTKAVDLVRKAEHRELMKNGNECLKGSKYQWLRTNSKMDGRGRTSFNVLRKIILKTSRAWMIKETASVLWDYVYRRSAEKAWLRLLSWMSRSRLEPMIKLGKTIRKNLWAILNAVELKESNAYAESNNARIQKIKKMSCGFRNPESFKNAIYFHCGELDLSPRTVACAT